MNLASYTPSGRTHAQTIPALLATGFGGAAVIALAFGVLSQWLDLIILFPILMGLGLGYALKMGVARGHCRHTAIVLLLAIPTGLFLYGAKMYVQYRMNRSEMLGLIALELAKQEAAPGVTLPSPEEAYEGWLEEKTGSHGFVGWAKKMLNDGITLSRSGSKNGMNLGWYGSLILLLVEAGLVAFMAYTTAAEQVSQPYCEKCGQWGEANWSRTVLTQETNDFCQELAAADDKDLPGVQGWLLDLPPGNPAEEHGEIALIQCKKCWQTWLNAKVATPRPDGKGTDDTILLSMAWVSPVVAKSLLTPAPVEAEEPAQPETQEV